MRKPCSAQATWDVLEAMSSGTITNGQMEISIVSGYSHPTVVRALQLLVKRGYVTHPRFTTWMITERGKIALAIHAGVMCKRRNAMLLPSPDVREKAAA
jgi:hypothetical protein